MTDKEAKKELMRRAASIDATVRVGKDGLGDQLLEEIRQQLKNRRLIKVKVLNNSDLDASDAAAQIATATESVAVDVRGGVIVLTDRRTWESLCQKKF
jgi:RNA-binding protein